jgi:hypothetical protein
VIVKKIAQNVAQLIASQYCPMDKSSQKMRPPSALFIKLLKATHHQIVENSPNLVTLACFKSG